MYAGSARRTLAHVSSLRQDVAGGTVLAGLADARVQRLLAVSAGELRRTNASVVRRIVLLHRVIAVVVIVLVLRLVIVIALAGDAALPRVLLGSRLLDRRAMRTTASDYVHPALPAPIVPASASFLEPPAFPTIAQILLEDRLARRAVLTGQIGAGIVTALLHAVTLEDVLVATHVEIHVDPINLQLADAAEKSVTGTDVIVDSVRKNLNLASYLVFKNL